MYMSLFGKQESLESDRNLEIKPRFQKIQIILMTFGVMDSADSGNDPNKWLNIIGYLFKPGMRRPQAGVCLVFLKLILCGSSVCVFVCVCVSAPEAINN